MGRAEPRNDKATMWPDMTDFQQRFGQIQSDFIENPKSAVENAEHLMDEAIDRWTKSMHEQVQSMHRDSNGGDADTEQLRLTMRSYRELMQSLGGRRAA